VHVGRIAYWLVLLVLGGPALALTAARLFELDWGPAIRLVSFTPVALLLYTALVIVLLLGSLLRERGARSRRLAGTLVAMAGLAVHLWWFSPQIMGDNPEPAAGARPMIVMNANHYEGHADADQLMQAVVANKVDVLVMEEITPDELARLRELGISDRLPYSIGTADVDVSGTMVFADRRLTGVVRLPTTFQSYRVSLGTLVLIAAHPVSPEFPDGWRADHQVILEAAVGSHADLVVGDLNATPDHVVMLHLQDAGFRDVGELANEGWQPTWPANHLGVLPLLPPTVRIDHVLVAKTLAAIETHTVDIDGTDHLALVAEVALR
jgi:endonuclease/exonuclease/phosphatase (EEP) superfamily protein YafD